MSVYTVVEENQLITFLEEYNVGSLESFEGISAGIENTNYFVNTRHNGQLKQFVLTIFEHHNFEELPYFLNIMAFMAEHKIPTAHPMPTRAEEYLKELCGKPASLVTRLPGRGVDHPSIMQCTVMGEQLARFHLAGLEYEQTRDNDRGIEWMQSTFNEINAHLTAEERDLIATELDYQNQIDWAHLPQGVIHADLFCDNALFKGDELTGIIDLYYACNAPFLYDLAVMVNDWCRIETENLSDMYFDESKMASMLFAYQQQRLLTEAEQQTWPTALRLAALRFFLSRLQDKCMPREGEMTQIKDPDVFKQVLKIHRL